MSAFDYAIGKAHCIGCIDFAECENSARKRCEPFYTFLKAALAMREREIESEIDKDNMDNKINNAVGMAFKSADTEVDEKPLTKVCQGLNDLLLYKNEKYGNSALEPIGVFNKLDAKNSILIRLDDKISRIRNGKEVRKNDVVDVMGYLALLCVANEWFDFSEYMD